MRHVRAPPSGDGGASRSKVQCSWSKGGVRRGQWDASSRSCCRSLPGCPVRTFRAAVTVPPSSGVTEPGESSELSSGDRTRTRDPDPSGGPLALKDRGRGGTCISICVRSQKRLPPAATPPDKCPANSQYFHYGGAFVIVEMAARAGPQMGPPPPALALTYEPRAEPDEHA